MYPRSRLHSFKLILTEVVSNVRMQELFPKLDAVKPIHSQKVASLLSSQLFFFYYSPNNCLNLQFFNLNKVKRYSFDEEYDEKIALDYLHQ